jgi:diguanylate cyclase (GGDEF)-like protein
LVQTIGESLAGNVEILKAKASKSAIEGVLIGIAAIVLATLLVSYYQTGAVSPSGIIQAQKNNYALWVLDAMPFAFALWGQYVSSLMAYEAGALIIDRTVELHAETTALQQRAMHDVTHDTLTGLPNRLLLRDRLEQAVNAGISDGGQLALIMMDLDRFKDINDTLGHHAGDRVLRQFATRLQSTMGSTDTFARIGDDEFAVILPRVKGVGPAVHMARRIAQALQVPFAIEGFKLDVQVSIGITLFPDHGPDGDTLLQRAEVAMYVAKQRKSGFVVYDRELDQHSPHRLTLAGELREGIDHGQLVLHYQPKVRTGPRTVEAFEALVRWQHPQHQLILPNEFIPLAERTGLIKPLTRWVLDRALRDCVAWRAAGLDAGVSVNLSADSLIDTDLADMIAGLLAATGLPAASLILEITETAIIVDPHLALQILTRLAETGVRLSIDDFGTGYSSLAYLSQLPVHELKIDKSFVMEMIDNPKNAMIVRATVDLAHDLGLLVVGEGTCNAQIFAELQMLGCDLVQGDFIGTPLAAEKLNSWATRGGRMAYPHVSTPPITA